MSFNTPITMPRTPKKTAKGKRPYRPELEAGADDNDSIQSTEMDPKTPVPSPDKNALQFDYCTYAPVVTAAVTRLLFALAAANRWCIYQLDVAVAFLNGIM